MFQTVVVDNFSIVESESSSKGNQKKFYHNGVWYKMDTEHCSEGLAESFVSCIEGCIIDFSFVGYSALRLQYRDEFYNGCHCFTMYNDADVSFVSLRSILRKHNISLSNVIANDCLINIKNCLEIVYRETGLDILMYLRDCLFLDALILNEDRHLMNLGVCFHRRLQKYFIAPVFDNGSSLFCVNWTYRKRKSLEENLKSAESVARPFSKFYDKQIEALLQMGVPKLKINRYRLFGLLKNYHNDLYAEDKINLIKDVVRYNLEKYNGVIYEFVDK